MVVRVEAEWAAVMWAPGVAGTAIAVVEMAMEVAAMETRRGASGAGWAATMVVRSRLWR